VGKISAIILDWAGTAVDYGCFAPVDAFLSAFAAFGLSPTLEETRAPMGLQKRAHIEKMLAGVRLAAQWEALHGTPPAREDIDRIYARFEPALFEALPAHAEPLPGALDAVAKARAMGIAIGSTTGYTRAMMDVLAPLAKQKGYAPDCLVCPEETGGLGRPYPYMLWRNLETLGVAYIGAVLKVGDTAADMEEGKNAGCLCVGVLKGSSMAGLSQEELQALGTEARQALFRQARQNYFAAGADYVIEEIAQLPALLKQL
jgi:phosphonoacetaldehyde hydrolase